jgi:surface antigen
MMAVLSPAQIAVVAHTAGFAGNALVMAIAIAMAESGGNAAVQHLNSDGSTDIGLWQINTVHTQYSRSLLPDPVYNARAAYAISGGGASWRAWCTAYNDGACGTRGGAYLGPASPFQRYMTVARAAVGSPTVGGVFQSVQIASASSNLFPKGQCTWWACQRYKELEGHYVPWRGDAHSWSANAKGAQGWNVSNAPKVPSIICLQANVQGAGGLGHVAVVESINSNGTLRTSNQNWAGVTYPNVAYVTHTAGNGVSFIYVNSGASSGVGTTQLPVTSTTSASTPAVAAQKIDYVPLTEQVHKTLTSHDGFYAIALAIDEAEQFPGWIDLVDHKAPGPLPDFVGLVRSAGVSVTDNFTPFIIRSGLTTLGLILLISLLLKPVLGVAGRFV